MTRTTLASTFTEFPKTLNAEGGWSGIADRPDWGLFKFGHTHPLQSNSGLQALVLMAYDFHQKDQGLTLADIPFLKYQRYGLRIDLPTVCEPPSPQVVNNLQQMWQRSVGTR